MNNKNVSSGVLTHAKILWDYLKLDQKLEGLCFIPNWAIRLRGKFREKLRLLIEH